MRHLGHAALAVGIALVGCFEPVAEHGLIGPEGGSFTQSGVSITVPPGALSAQVQLSISTVDAAPPAGYRSFGAAAQLGPEGLQFAQPARLALRVSSAASAVEVATRPVEGTTFQLLPAHFENGQAVTEVMHFSIFIPVTPTDGGTFDAGPADGGVEDAGPPDAGPPPPLETCQPLNAGPLKWTSLPNTGAIGATNAANVLVVERPGGYVFTVGNDIVSVNHQLEVLETHNTFTDTPSGGWTGLNGFTFGDEVILNSAVAEGAMMDYAEWRIGADGHLPVSHRPDAGSTSRVLRDWTYYVGNGFQNFGSGCGISRPRDALLAAAGVWWQPSVGQIPRDLASPVLQARLPSKYSDSSAGVGLPDGSVLYALGEYLPSFAQSTQIRLDVHTLEPDGGLLPTSWSVTRPTGSVPMLVPGGQAGYLFVEYGLTAVTFTEPPPAEPVTVMMPPLCVGISGQYDPVRLAADGGVLAIAVCSRELTTSRALYLVRYPVRDALLVHAGLSTDQPVGLGAIRSDSFVVAWHDLRALHVARVCLPP
jgi:hypothetical protein